MLAGILWGLVWLVLALLLVLAVFLLLPVRVRAQAETAPKRRVTVQVQVLGVLPWMTVTGESRPPKRDKPPKPERKQRRKRRRGKGLDWRRLAAGLPRLLLDWLRQVRIERLRVDAAFGLGDPADTGVLWGRLTPLIYGAGLWQSHVALRPVFDRACLEGEAELQLSLVPARLIPPALRFAWTAFGPEQ